VEVGRVEVGAVEVGAVADGAVEVEVDPTELKEDEVALLELVGKELEGACPETSLAPWIVPSEIAAPSVCFI